MPHDNTGFTPVEVLLIRIDNIKQEITITAQYGLCTHDLEWELKELMSCLPSRNYHYQ